VENAYYDDENNRGAHRAETQEEIDKRDLLESVGLGTKVSDSKTNDLRGALEFLENQAREGSSPEQDGLAQEIKLELAYRTIEEQKARVRKAEVRAKRVEEENRSLRQKVKEIIDLVRSLFG
jgi:hypothetical protein